MWATSVIFYMIVAQSKQSPIGRNFANLVTLTLTTKRDCST
jgi:hypothetical protein